MLIESERWPAPGVRMVFQMFKHIQYSSQKHTHALHFSLTQMYTCTIISKLQYNINMWLFAHWNMSFTNLAYWLQCKQKWRKLERRLLTYWCSQITWPHPPTDYGVMLSSSFSSPILLPLQSHLFPFLLFFSLSQSCNSRSSESLSSNKCKTTKEIPTLIINLPVQVNI